MIESAAILSRSSSSERYPRVQLAPAGDANELSHINQPQPSKTTNIILVADHQNNFRTVPEGNQRFLSARLEDGAEKTERS